MITKNKLIGLIMLLGILLIPSIQGCKKYAEGPAISFRSRTERVSNTWKVDNYKKNGNDYTSFVTNYEETYTKNGAYSYSSAIYSGSGSWQFQNSYNDIRLINMDKNDIRTLHILKLEENNFWYYYIEDNDRYEYHLISK